MDSRSLARNLARSLAKGPWSRIVVRDTLARRFPAQLQHLVEAMSAELVKALPFAYAPHVTSIADVMWRSEEFEQVFNYCRQHDVWPSPDLSPPVMAPIPAFVQFDVPQLPTVESLAEWLFLPVERLEYLADVSGRYAAHHDHAVNHYHYLFQAKKSGGIRLIESPKPHLKAVQRQILHGVLDRIPVHANAYGFVRGRSCVAAAGRHAGEEAVVCFDVKTFFPSIGSGRIFGLFRCLGYPCEVARILTGLCTSTTPQWVVNQLASSERDNHRKAHLPQGAPTSPSLANFAVFTLDRRLSGLARRLNFSYSRYADDLTFSGDGGTVGTLLRAVPSVVADEGFQLNAAKTRVMSRTSRQVVTGIVVNEHLNIDRREFDRLKAVIHACRKPDDPRLDDPSFRSSLLGKIAWIESVNPQRGRKLWDLLAIAAGRRMTSP